MDNHTLLIIFVALTGISVLIQAIVLIGILSAITKAAKVVTENTNDLKATILPIVHSTKELVERISPQVVVVTAGLAELTEVIRRETKDVHISAAAVMGRVNRQTERLDAMVTSALDVMEKTGVVLENAVSTPVRQVNGIFAAVRAVIDTYRTTNPRSEAYRASAPRNSANPYRSVKVAETEKDFVI